MAGNPISTARLHARRREARGPVSHENSECTWLSGGSIAAHPTGRPQLPHAGFAMSVAPHTVRGMSAPVATPLADEALGVLRELTGRPDAVFREGQDPAVGAPVDGPPRAAR